MQAVISKGCQLSFPLSFQLNEAFQNSGVSTRESKTEKAAWELRRAATLLLWDPPLHPNALHDKRPARHLAAQEKQACFRLHSCVTVSVWPFAVGWIFSQGQCEL